MVPTSVEKALKEIANLKNRDPHLTSEMKDRIQTLQMELGFLKMFIWLLPTNSLRKSYITAIVGKGKLGIYGNRVRAIDLAASKLLLKFELCKQRIREDCLYLLDFSSHCKFSSRDELLQFINCTRSNLRNLVRLKAGAIVSVRMQVGALIKKLRIFRDFVKSTEELLCFSIDIQDWAHKIARLSTLYWADQMEEAMAATMKAILTDLLQMVNSYSPEVIGLYVRVLKASKSPPCNTSEIGEVVFSQKKEIGEVAASFVDFILPIGFMKILREDLIFLIAFLMDPDPPQREMNEEDWNLVLTKAKAVACEIPSLICSLTVGEMNQEIAKERKFLLRDFHEKTNNVKAEVRKLHFQIPESSRSHFPATNALGFIDSLLENLGNLKETLISQTNFLPFARDQLWTLHEELVSLRPSLENIQDMQNEFEELKDLWKQITDAAYQAEHVIDSCQIFDVPIWYNVICLSDAIEEIKTIKRQTEETIKRQTKEIMDNRIYTNGILNAKVNSGSIHRGQAYRSSLDEVVDIFKDEEETIINRLIGGSMKLEIVSIVGMAGQGKTTLAKKVYHSSSIQHHFHKHAWCFVSQVYEVGILLLDILRQVTTGPDDKIHNLKKEELEHKLYQCLKGRKYLIIMDDIWEKTAWEALEKSFPDDNNCSRILFTSRNDFGYNPHWLRSLSDKESTELLEQKLFPESGWPSNFSSDLEKILKVCNGLALAIVVVAGLLQGVSNDSGQWSKIVQNLNPKLASEGCMDVLELSYKNMPDLLKPCFLYIGALGRQTKVFKVRKLIQLWTAEGFVQKHGEKNLEEVAKEYLKDLIARSVVIVHKRSFSSGDIKECRIHDLFRELCLKKAEEERFIHFPNPPNNSSKPINYDQYRLCTYGEWMVYSLSKSTGPNVRSLFILRSLLFPYYWDPSTFVIRLKFLRVLEVGSLNFRGCFPEEILLLIFLRYLSIVCPIKYVPSAIENLCNLENFHLVREACEDGIVRFPHTIWKMKMLRNVDVGTGAIILPDDNGADECPKLDNLVSFSSLYLFNVEDAEKLLSGFPEVRKLKLLFARSWDCKRNCGGILVLHKLGKLESLNLQYSEKVAHTCAFNFPENLKELTLSQFNHGWSEISTIGKLPRLEVLRLLNSTTVEIVWYVEEDAFLKLKYLKLSRLDISHWDASDSSFPCLERLLVGQCRFLAELPSIFGETETLKMIEVRGCPKGLGTSAESILKEQVDAGNEDLEVLISDVLREARPEERTPPGWPNSLTFSLPNVYDGWHNKATSSFETAVCAAHNVREPFELDEEGVIEIYVREPIKLDKKGVKERYVPIARRTNLLLKHNCQPRQTIMSRHSKEELKRDG